MMKWRFNDYADGARKVDHPTLLAPYLHTDITNGIVIRLAKVTINTP